jgi:dihydrofolate reductase
VALTLYSTASTLDGFVADAGDSLAWLFAVDTGEGDSGFTDFMAGVGAMTMGATTYTWLLDNEGLREHPEKWRTWHGDTPCWVFTHRDLPVPPDAPVRLVSGDVADVHREMVAAAGDRTVWVVGGGDLAGQFADRGLLDEIIVDVAPVTLGAGRPLLPRRLESDRLELVDVARRGQFARLHLRVRR